MSGHVTKKPDPPKSGSAYMTTFLKGVKGQRGVWASGGTRRRPAGGEGRHLGRKGKCRSTLSKPYHMLQSAGISPLAPTRKLCKRLLIWESACRKNGVLVGAKASRWTVSCNAFHVVSQHGQKADQISAGGANRLAGSNPVREKLT